MIYEPAEDSRLLADSLFLYLKDKSFLDMGSGSGIQSRNALKAGAKNTLAVDINFESVRFLKKINIPVIHSDLFSNVKGKFDVIAFNPPYLPENILEDKESSQITSGGKRGDEIILKFLKSAQKHLSKNGLIFLVLSSLTPKKRILSLLKKIKFSHKIISSESLFMETLYVWKINRRI